MNLAENFKALASHVTAPQLAEELPYGEMPYDIDEVALSKLLLNSWSAEYALRITPVVNDEQYLQSSLHWTFPQAYYSVLFSVRALLLTHEDNIGNEELIRRRVGKLVARNYYPKSFSFYGLGLHNIGFMNLSPTVQTLREFIRAVRLRRIEQTFNRLGNRPDTALRDYDGNLLTDWKQVGLTYGRTLAKWVAPTTYFDLLTVLRISSQDRELEQLTDGLIDVKAFHADLIAIVESVNAVHEYHVARKIGYNGYKALLDKLPSYLIDSFIRDRFRTVITPSLASNIFPVRKPATPLVEHEN